MDTPPNPNDQEPDLSAPGSGPGRLTVSEFWELPGDPAFCPELRHRIRRSLADYPHAVDDAELVVAELFANACHHSVSGDGGKISVTLSALRTGLVLVTVADQGPKADPHTRLPSIPHTRTDAGLLSRGGRGLHLVAALAADWGHWNIDSGGYTVWALFAPPGATRLPDPPLPGSNL